MEAFRFAPGVARTVPGCYSWRPAGTGFAGFGADMQDPVREIILDTETTGLDPATGDRIIEVAAVEIIGTEETGRVFHRFFDPERDIPEDATRIHGITNEFIRGKPVFEEFAAELAEFIDGATLVIHNAPFDLGFLNAEFGYLGVKPNYGAIVDTLRLARKRFPNQSNTVDALCDRLGVDRTSRAERHGALIDVKLLAQVYIKILGRDQLIPIDIANDEVVVAATGDDSMPETARQRWFPARGLVEPSPEEVARHAAFLGEKDWLWKPWLNPEPI